MRQETLTLVAPLTRVERVRKIVESYACDRSKVPFVLGRGNAQPRLFQGLGIHFARIVLIDEPSTSPYRAVLLLESNFDTVHEGSDIARSAHLALLARERGEVLRELWADAIEPLPREDGAALEAALARCLAPHTAAYQGHVHRDLARIELEAQIRDVALSCAARLPRGMSDAEVLREVRTRVGSELRFDLECDAPGLPDPARRRELMLHPKRAWGREAIPFLLGGAACFPLTVVLAALLLYRERNDRPYDLQTEAESVGPELLQRLAANSESEDYGTQNALTHLVPVRGGFGRHLTLRVTHAYLAKVAQNHFNYVEQLGGIPSIHFAKWLLIDGGRRLLFFSNYDGSWESYLGDFVDQAALGLNLAWMCTEGYPNTRFVGEGGANDEETFKAWARVHQRPTELFYSAYPALSVADVNNNSWLRCGLHRGGPDDIERWVRRFT
jgi:hypothetical protein